MVSKYEEEKETVPCAFFHLKYGFDGMTEEQAEIFAHSAQKALQENTNIKLVNFHLEGFDHMNCPKPEDMA